MITYEDQHFLVTKSFFKGWRVKEKSTGATILPDARLRERINLLWPRIRRNKDYNPSPSMRFGEDALFQLFAFHAANPNTPVAHKFAELPIDTVERIVLDFAFQNMKQSTNPAAMTALAKILNVL